MVNIFNISYHHVGGRGGKFPIGIPEVLRDCVDLTMYDADETCCEEAKRSHFVRGFNQVNVLPFCISSKDGFANFIITKQPHASSLLEASPEAFPFIRNSPKFGAMRLQEILAPHKRVRLETRKLSTALSLRGVDGPNFISLDTQGNEFDIIESSKEIFQNALLINTEISFSELYKGQKNFPEIHNLMMSLGFSLVDLRLYDQHHSCSTPIDFESKGFQLDGEAFYIKKPDLEKWDFQTLLKYCFAALLCEQTHLCIRIFDALDSRFPNKLDELNHSYSYINLIYELSLMYKQSHKIYLPNFHESNTYKEYHATPTRQYPLMGSGRPNADLETLEQSQYSSILQKYGLHGFSDNINNYLALNIDTLRKIHNGT